MLQELMVRTSRMQSLQLSHEIQWLTSEPFRYSLIDRNAWSSSAPFLGVSTIQERDFLLSKSIVFEGLDALFWVDCASEDIMHPKLPWEQILQYMNSVFYVIVIWIPIQNIYNILVVQHGGDFSNSRICRKPKVTLPLAFKAARA